MPRSPRSHLPPSLLSLRGPMTGWTFESRESRFIARGIRDPLDLFCSPPSPLPSLPSSPHDLEKALFITRDTFTCNIEGQRHEETRSRRFPYESSFSWTVCNILLHYLYYYLYYILNRIETCFFFNFYWFLFQGNFSLKEL